MELTDLVLNENLSCVPTTSLVVIVSRCKEGSIV